MEGLVLLVLEAGVALGLLVFIVWWTWPRHQPPADESEPPSVDSGGAGKRDGD